MLAIDNSNKRLLDMKEKFLELSSSNKDEKYYQALDEYASLATSLDKEVCDAFVNKIKNTNYQSLPFDEQMNLLQDIIDQYNDIYECQCLFNENYQKHAGKSLKLSNLDVVCIDNIQRKLSSLVGYLNNEKMLKANKEALNKVSAELAELERKRNSAFERFSAMEKNLQYEFLNSDSIIEYRDNGFDLRKLLTDSEVLKETTASENELKNAAEEKLIAAKICCESLPSAENKEIYESISVDMLWARYRLTLLQMASLVADQKEEYADLVEKRRQLKALNDMRDNCLRKLNFKYFAPIITNYKIDSQLDIIKNYEELEEKITVLRNQVVKLSTLVEDKQRDNTDYMLDLNSKYEFIKDSLDFDKVVINTLGEVEETIPKKVRANQVIKVANPKEDFKYNRVKEKTSSVIKTANRIYNGKEDIVEKKVVMESPELVLEQSEAFVEQPDEEIAVQLPDETHEEVLDEVKEEPEQDVKIVDANSVDEFTNTKTDTDTGLNEDLFESTEPFADVQLFSDKYENDELSVDNLNKPNIGSNSIPAASPGDPVMVPIFDTDFEKKNEAAPDLAPKLASNNTVSEPAVQMPQMPVNQMAQSQMPMSGGLDTQMPEMFWTTREEKKEESVVNNEPTFDEQINMLMENGNGRQK